MKTSIFYQTKKPKFNNLLKENQEELSLKKMIIKIASSKPKSHLSILHTSWIQIGLSIKKAVRGRIEKGQDKFKDKPTNKKKLIQKRFLQVWLAYLGRLSGSIFNQSLIPTTTYSLFTTTPFQLEVQTILVLWSLMITRVKLIKFLR